MKNAFKKTTLSLALGATLIGGTAWSTSSLACSTEDYISSICAMAAANLNDFGSQFMLANGRALPVNNYAALYSLVGATYGSPNPSSFNIPDLRGRIVIGAGQGPNLPNFSVGQSGGGTSFTLTLAQLPQHTHALNVPVDISQMTATTTLGGLSATVSGTLTLKASTGGTRGNDPTGKSLATTAGPTTIYSDAAPTIGMNSNSIDSSGLTVGNFTGSPTTRLGGTATATGNTGSAGTGQAVSFMPPYLAMKYFIAALGLYPSND